MGKIRGFDELGAIFGLKKEETSQQNDTRNLKGSTGKSGNNNRNFNNKGGNNNNQRGANGNNKGGYGNLQRGANGNNRGGYNNNQRSGQGNSSNVPTTPYNFVRLGECVVAPPLAAAISNFENEKQLTAEYTSFISQQGKYSGYFDVTIKNITPLYIGSGKDGSFFNNGEDICIPGSSLRGSLKNIFKIVTSSSFRSDRENPDITDRHLYFRSFADKHRPLRDEYTNRMSGVDEKGKARSVAQAGLLVREKSNYYVIPSELSTQKGIYVKLNDNEFVYIGVNANPRSGAQVRWHNDYVDIFTGKMNDKKTFHRISNPRWNDKLEVPKELVEDYRNDESLNRYDLLSTKEAVNGANIKKISYKDNIYDDIVCTAYEFKKSGNGPKRPVRSKKDVDSSRYRNEIESQRTRYRKDSRPADDIKFLAGGKQYDFIIPCFYTESGGVVTGFGATPYFRITYKKTIGDHIPAALNKNVIDFTDAVFGNKGYWAGRVFFEDLYLEDGAAANMEKPAQHKVLAGAKPTSFQFYLQGKNGNAAMWSEETSLRGYKLYWHKKESWVAPPDVKEKMTSVITPLKENHIFTGKIRFENLDAIELGAMCYLFSLGKEQSICYKIGGGKSIGMGTVELKGDLVLRSDDYYEKLFDGASFAECKADASIEEFTQQFNDYMTNKLRAAGGNKEKAYRAAMEELRLIMSVANMDDADWNAKTRYMDINNTDDKKVFKERIPLPNIKTVFNSGAKK